MIADEVAVGFGRTGTLFACEQEQVSPDLLCLGKGITGGYLPLAATLCTDAIYEAFLGPPAAGGPSITVIPIPGMLWAAPRQSRRCNVEQNRTLDNVRANTAIIAEELARFVITLKSERSGRVGF